MPLTKSIATTLASTSTLLFAGAFGCSSESETAGATGGVTSAQGGAAPTGGTGTGGASTGGASTGGSSTGGVKATGGVSTGGASTGGAATGGSAGTAGASAGGGAGNAGSPGGGGGGTDGGGGSGGASAGGGSGGASAGGGSGGAPSKTGEMSFFVSSAGPSATGDLDGLDGADAHCLTLAMAAGSTKTQWFAYLSAEGGGTPVNARDRIGGGPWYNADGDIFAASLAALHPMIDPEEEREDYIAAKPADELFMDENGDAVPSGVHDILTGSDGDGMLIMGSTCNDWNSAEEGEIARLGHSDTPASFSASWNSAHDSAGCSADNLDSTGGEGRIYCFATD